LELSKEQFQHAVAVNEVWIEALYGLALVCIKLKQPLEAIEHLKKALQISSDS
jgi:tetratricopeptide (TPR) repeat protein